jgi:hypothetical protein
MVQLCGYCHEKPRGGMASVYWAWFDADHQRVAYRVKYCAPDAARYLKPLLVAWLEHLDNQFSSLCDSCGEQLEQEQNVIYARIYLPGHEERDLDASLCDSCYAKLAGDFIEHGEQLKNRDQFAPAHANTAWTALGIYPVASQ